MNQLGLNDVDSDENDDTDNFMDSINRDLSIEKNPIAKQCENDNDSGDDDSDKDIFA